jgi:hypothetical protein
MSYDTGPRLERIAMSKRGSTKVGCSLTLKS